MATLRRKRVSKKNKKSWRKNVNIEDVEDFLDDQRLEERTGFKVSEMPDEALFEICTSGSNTENISPFINAPVKESSISYKLREIETPVCFSPLINKSAVKDPLIKRNRTKTREEKRHPAVKKIFQERLEKGILTMKQKMSLADRKKAEILRKKKSNLPQFKYELWSTENKPELENYAEWLTKDTVRHTLSNTGTKRKRVPKSITTKPSLLPAVEIPHPGTSYNPSLKDHTDILQEVVETEKKMVKEEKRLKRATTDMFSKVTRDVADNEWLKEMSAGLVETKEDSNDEEDSGDYTTVNPPVKNKKKTLKQRRKQREAAQLQAKLRLKKIEKKKISDIYKLRKLNAMLKKQEALTRLRKKKKEKLNELKPLQTKKLANKKYQEPLLDYCTAEELTGNLRGVQQKANLLVDRYKSLQKRNILEPAVKYFAKKAKRKRYERESTKMGWEPKGY